MKAKEFAELCEESAKELRKAVSIITFSVEDFNVSCKMLADSLMITADELAERLE